MSFAYILKNEICKNKIQNDNLKFAKAYGMLSFGKSFNVSCISIHTRNKNISKLYTKLIYELVKIETCITTQEFFKNNEKTLNVTVDSLEDRLRILSFFGHKKASTKIHTSYIQKEEEMKAFLCGVFVVCGNISDPQKSYHLEFVCPTTHHKKILEGILKELGLSLKLTTRRDLPILYTKDSEQIEKILVLIGAVKSTFSLIDVKIYKDLRNNINRVTNCETANIVKTVSASTQQISDIKYLKSINQFDCLNNSLKDIAELRLNNPDLSLRELSELTNPPISKSGINHRFSKITKIAQELRNKQ